MDDLFDLDACGQADLLRRREVSPVELVDGAIANAQRLNPTLNAIVIERYERARAEAAAQPLDAPFAGVPIVLKDLGCPVEGEETHQGTRVLKNEHYRAPATAAIYHRLRAAGFIAIGRTNTPEWGTSITAEPLSYGPARNPWHTEHSTGGSSGGTGAAVAARIVAVGHGNDGGGSIRIPSANCALVGLKPSRARVSHAPEGEVWAGSATDGALTRTVRDAAALLDVLAGYEVGDASVAPALARPLADEVGAAPGSLRIGFTTGESSGKAIAPDCIAALDAATALLADLGHRVEQGAPSSLDDPGFSARFGVVVAANSAVTRRTLEAELGRTFGEGDLEPDNLALTEVGATIPATVYLETVAAQAAWAREVQSWWSGDDAFDLLVSPVMTQPPATIGWLTGPEGQARIQARMLYTAQFNVTGQPAISLPLYWSADGLPIGVQLVAAYGREDLLVRVAAQLEQAAPWASRRPPVCATGAES